MRVTFYGGPLDGGKEKLDYEPERGELWSFYVPPFTDEPYVYDCQGHFVYLRTSLGKAIYNEKRAKK